MTTRLAGPAHAGSAAGREALEARGQVLAETSQDDTQYMLPAPSLPQLPDAQSVFEAHGEPSPPAAPGPATHTPWSQTSVDVHPAAMSTSR